jgi:hypothetical protein
MEKALIDLDGKRMSVGERLAQALSDWKGDTFDEEEVEDDGEECATGAFVWKNLVLHGACSSGEVDSVKRLLNAGVNTDAMNEDKYTPLHVATMKGHVEVVKLLVKALLAEGLDVDAKDEGGFTPLQYACERGHVEMVQVLVQAGADFDVDDGWPPLHIASEAGHVEVVKLLVAEGADVGATNYTGQTPLEVATMKGHSECYLLLAMREEELRHEEEEYWREKEEEEERIGSLSLAQRKDACREEGLPLSGTTAVLRARLVEDL